MYKVLIVIGVIGSASSSMTSQVLSYDEWDMAEEAIRNLKANFSVPCVITRLYDES